MAKKDDPFPLLPRRSLYESTVPRRRRKDRATSPAAPPPAATSNPGGKNYGTIVGVRLMENLMGRLDRARGVGTRQETIRRILDEHLPA